MSNDNKPKRPIRVIKDGAIIRQLNDMGVTVMTEAEEKAFLCAIAKAREGPGGDLKRVRGRLASVKKKNSGESE